LHISNALKFVLDPSDVRNLIRERVFDLIRTLIRARLSTEIVNDEPALIAAINSSLSAGEITDESKSGDSDGPSDAWTRMFTDLLTNRGCSVQITVQSLMPDPVFVAKSGVMRLRMIDLEFKHQELEKERLNQEATHKNVQQAAERRMELELSEATHKLTVSRTHLETTRHEHELMVDTASRLLKEGMRPETVVCLLQPHRSVEMFVPPAIITPAYQFVSVGLAESTQLAKSADSVANP
jgi:hypothetical protein